MLFAGCSNESSKVYETSNENSNVNDSFNVHGSSKVSDRSNAIEEERNKIIVQKRVGEENNYKQYAEITDDETVQQAKNLLDSISWEIAKVEMERSADYKFDFATKEQKSNWLKYEQWISPNKDKIDIVISSESKNGKLDKTMSA